MKLIAFKRDLGLVGIVGLWESRSLSTLNEHQKIILFLHYNNAELGSEIGHKL